MEEKRFFIADDNTVRWVHTFLNKDIQWDNGFTHLVVTMSNNLNTPHRPNEVKVESIRTNEFFATLKEAQMEIIRRERFQA